MKRAKLRRLPIPLLSALKSSVGVLDRFCDLELLERELVRVKREVAQLGVALLCISITSSKAA